MLSCSFGMWGQGYTIANLEKGDRAFNDGNYYTAAAYYEKLIDEVKGQTDGASEDPAFPYEVELPSEGEKDFETYQYIIDKLARSYRLYNDYPKAEIWYAKSNSLKEGKDMNTLYWYGVVLRANEKYDEAIIQFDKILKNESESSLNYKRAEFQKECCLFAQRSTEHPKLVFLNRIEEGEVNKDGSSNYAYTRSPSEKGYVFTTTRYTIKDPLSDAYRYNNTLLANSDTGLAELDIPLEKAYNIAAPSVTDDGKTMYFNIWSDIKDQEEEEGEKAVHKIYMSYKKDGKWSIPADMGLAVNAVNARNLYPNVSGDGTVLYFASDRAGGAGGLDIYKVNLDSRGLPEGPAENLGLDINTKEDDAHPYFNVSEQMLYFSSDGRVGVGGLDIFKSSWEGESWTEPENMGYPVNSSKDDAYPFVFADNERKGVISSDRSAECCYELFEYELGYYYGKGLVVDKATQEPVAGATIHFIDSTTQAVLDSMVTDSNGIYHYELELNRNYLIKASMKDYLSSSAPFITPESVTESDTVDFPLLELISIKVGSKVVLNNIFYDFNSADLRVESKFELNKLVDELVKHPELVVEIGSHTDSVGSDQYNIDLSQRRSQSVVDYMISQGIPRSKIQAKGYGESQPVARNTNPDGTDNPEGRQLNRRTEFKVLSNDGMKVEYESGLPEETMLEDKNDMSDTEAGSEASAIPSSEDASASVIESNSKEMPESEIDAIRENMEEVADEAMKTDDVEVE